MPSRDEVIRQGILATGRTRLGCQQHLGDPEARAALAQLVDEGGGSIAIDERAPLFRIVRVDPDAMHRPGNWRGRGRG